MVTIRDPFAGGGGSGGGGTPFPGFATTAQAQLGTETGVASSPANVASYIRHVSGEENFSGFTRYTGSIASIGLGQFGFSAAPATPPGVFAQTIHLRAHNATEHASVMSEATAGSVVLIRQTAAINTESRVAVIQAIPVSGSDVPRIQMFAVYHAARGTFSNDTNCDLDIVGAVKSLSARSGDEKFGNGGNNVPIGNGTWVSVPNKNTASDVAADNQLELFVSSRASTILTSLSAVLGWLNNDDNSGDTSWVAHARVQTSVDGGSTWTTQKTFNNLMHTTSSANQGVSISTLLRLGVSGRVLVRWQMTRGSGRNWDPDSQSTTAVVV